METQRSGSLTVRAAQVAVFAGEGERLRRLDGT